MVAFASAYPRVGISSVEIVTERCGSFRFHPRPRRLAAEAVLFYALCHDGVPGAAPEELLFDLRWKRSGHIASLTLLDPTNAPSHAVGSATFWMATAQFVIYFLTLRWVEVPDVLTALPNLPLPGRLGALLTRGIVPGPAGLNHKRHLLRLHRAVQRSQRAIPPPCESLSFPTDAALHETGLDESFAMVRFSKVKDDDS